MSYMELPGYNTEFLYVEEKFINVENLYLLKGRRISVTEQMIKQQILSFVYSLYM